jgi:hypothetical protein
VIVRDSEIDFCRFAVRAAKFGPEVDYLFRALGAAHDGGNCSRKRGSLKGAVKVPLRVSSFLFNALAFRSTPRKSLKSLSLLFSIPTAPAKPALSFNELQKT